MIQFSISDMIALGSLLLMGLGVYLAASRFRQNSLDKLRKELKVELETKVSEVQASLTISLDNISKQVQSIISNYAQKEDMRLHMQFQTELLQEIRKEQGRIHSRLDDVMKMALQHKIGD